MRAQQSGLVLTEKGGPPTPRGRLPHTPKNRRTNAMARTIIINVRYLPNQTEEGGGRAGRCWTARAGPDEQNGASHDNPEQTGTNPDGAGRGGDGTGVYGAGQILEIEKDAAVAP